MEKIKITFLGTSDAIPSKNRSHPSILLSYKSENILIDCGEGTQRQFKLANISPCKITKILITHWHGDHFFGLPGLLETIGLLGYNKTLEIYGPKGTKNKIDLIKKIANITIPLKVFEISNKKIFDTKEFEIFASSMSHRTPCNAYSFKIKDKLRLYKEKIKKLGLPKSPLLKKLQEGKDIKINKKTIKASQLTYLEKGKKITFILDTETNPNAIKIAKDSNLLVIESQFSESEKKHASEKKHLTATQAATIAKKANVKSLILTHISQRYQANLNKIEQEAKKVFKSVSIAKDLQTISL